MFDNLCKSWPRESQQCINRLKNKQTSYRVLNTVLIKVLYERCGSWPQKCYGDGYSTGWLRHFIATRRYEFFNFRSAEARSDKVLRLNVKLSEFYFYAYIIVRAAFHTLPLFYLRTQRFRTCARKNYVTVDTSYVKYLWSATRLHIVTNAKIYQLNT